MMKTRDLYFNTSLLIIAISIVHNSSLWSVIGLQPWASDYQWFWMVTALSLAVNLLAVIGLAGWLPEHKARDSLLLVQSLAVASILLVCQQKMPSLNLLSWCYLMMVLILTIRAVSMLSAVLLTLWVGLGFLLASQLSGSLALITVIALSLSVGVLAVMSTQHGLLLRLLDSKTEQLNETLRLVQQLTVRDDLTGLFNFRYVQQILTTQKQLADRGDFHFVVAKLQVKDMPPAAKDPEMHQVMLLAVADVLKSHTRSVDYCARIADDTFLLVLVNTHLEKARLVLQRVQMNLNYSGFEYQSKIFPLVLSIGLTEYVPTEALEVLLQRVDQALAHVCKHGGGTIHGIASKIRQAG
jgi:diguanylate cyclase (GGDEF)-like protein